LRAPACAIACASRATCRLHRVRTFVLVIEGICNVTANAVNAIVFQGDRTCPACTRARVVATHPVHAVVIGAFVGEGARTAIRLLR
jgi:hypothetical protein